MHVCVCLCESEREREGELLNVSVLAWLYSCIYATAICISLYVGKRENTHSLTKKYVYACQCVKSYCHFFCFYHFVGQKFNINVTC